MQLKTLSVREINEYIKNWMDKDIILKNLKIRGEISNLKYHKTGIYFTLKDEVSSIRCVMFNDYKNKLASNLEDGMAVIISGRISVYEKTGNYQLYVKEIELDGIGELFIAFNKLKEKLQKEGLFDDSNKKPIPKFPKKIAVITSPTGAAIKDIISISKRRNPGINLLIIPVLVQGEYAADDISNALETTNKRNDIDVIILGRGGGSLEEIWAFNEEKVARSIFSSKIPVISAVGHETDFTISDFVADLRAPTPSAAAELVVPDINIYKKEILTLRESLIKNMSVKIKNFNKEVLTIKHKLFILSPLRKTEFMKSKLLLLNKTLYNNIISIYSHKKSEFVLLAEKLNSLSPLNVLSRGYTMVVKEEKVITSVCNIQLKDKVKILFKDGYGIAEICEVAKNDERVVF
ncbi:MAG: exodeoxyribonuclease VII large subunit [Thermoanaerobacteraceae bacterium]